MAIRIGINGFGPIGRLVAHAIAEYDIQKGVLRYTEQATCLLGP